MRTIGTKAWRPSVFLATTLLSISAFAGAPKAMKIVSAAQTLAVGACSAPVQVRAVDAAGVAANVPQNTRIYFTGSNSNLKFFSDAGCATSVLECRYVCRD